MWWRRFLTYGAGGWIIEVLKTGTTSALLRRDRAATARTYLWMLPIYGAGGLLLERIEDVARRRGWSRGARTLAYLPAIYAVEAATGTSLRCLIRKCPWDYAGQGIDIRGLVRLDYVPLWLAVAYLFEPMRVLATALATGGAAVVPSVQDGSDLDDLERRPRDALELVEVGVVEA